MPTAITATVAPRITGQCTRILIHFRQRVFRKEHAWIRVEKDHQPYTAILRYGRTLSTNVEFSSNRLS